MATGWGNGPWGLFPWGEDYPERVIEYVNPDLRAALKTADDNMINTLRSTNKGTVTSEVEVIVEYKTVVSKS